jgi:hypothetical protein
MKWTRDFEGERLVRVVFVQQHGWPEQLARTLTAYNGEGGFAAFVNREHAGGRDTAPLRWHVSVKGPGRPPTWDELVASVHALRPGVCFVVGIPPRSWWMNVHPDVLHAWETTDEQIVEEFHVNARGDRPT